jgi:VanZ family protein
MTRWLWSAWVLCLALWTVALLTTFPVYVREQALPSDEAVGLPVAKVLHVSAYAFLAAFALWLRPPVVWRWLLVLFLLEHGVVTECLQGFVYLRGPSVYDALIDHIGVALGAAATWWRWWGSAR